MSAPPQPPRWWRDRWTVVGLLAALAMSAGLRTAYHEEYRLKSPYAAAPIGDAAAYDGLARAVAAGYLSGPEFAAHTPLYPLALGAVYAVFGPRFDAVLAWQGAMGLAVVALVFWLGLRVASAEVGVLAAGLVSLFGPLLFYETKLMPTTLAVLLTLLVPTLAHWAFHRPRTAWAVVSGIILGLLAAVRPNLLLVSLFLIAAGWWRGRRAEKRAADRRVYARAAWAVLGCAVVLTPLLVRAGGNLATHGGVTFYAGNQPKAEGIYRAPPGFSGTKRLQAVEARRIAEAATGRRGLSASEVSRYFYEQGLRWIAAHPGDYLVLLARKAYRFAAADEPRSVFSFGQERERHPELAVAGLPFSFFLIFGVLGLWWLPQVRRASWFGAIVAAYVATALIFFVASRYRVGLVPVLAVPAAALLLAGARGLGRLRTRAQWWGRRSLLLAVGVAVVATAVLSAVRPGDAARKAALEAFNRGVAFARQGRATAAAQEYARAVQRHPKGYLYWVHLGNAMVAARRPLDAIRHYRRAIALGPRRALARINLGTVAVERSRRRNVVGDAAQSRRWLVEARRELRRARELAPDNVDAMLALAVLQRRALGTTHLASARGLLQEGLRRRPALGELHVELGIVETMAAQEADGERRRAHVRAAQRALWMGRLLGVEAPRRWRRFLARLAAK